VSATPRPDRGSGFTLVELLVGMAVMSLVALTMAAGLRFVVQAVASTDGRREALEELTLGLAVLRNELERAEPMMVKVGNRYQVLFDGLPDRLRFANVEPPYLAGPPYLAYEYTVALDAGAHRVDLRRAPIDPNEPDLAAVAAGAPRTVLRLTRPVRFTYWGSLRPRDPPAWHEEWPPGPRLPDAIRLAAGEDPGWPDLVVPLRITAPWYCGAGTGADAAGGDAGGGAERPADEGDLPGAERPGGSDAGPGKTGCPGAEEDGDANQLAPAAAAQRAFGRDGGGDGGLGSRQ
jgi:general secretion pathway protein J